MINNPRRDQALCTGNTVCCLAHEHLRYPSVTDVHLRRRSVLGFFVASGVFIVDFEQTAFDAVTCLPEGFLGYPTVDCNPVYFCLNEGLWHRISVDRD